MLFIHSPVLFVPAIPTVQSDKMPCSLGAFLVLSMEQRQDFIPKQRFA